MKNMRQYLPQLIIVCCILFTGTLAAQTYVGSNSCMNCHSTQYNDWNKSGHPFKLQKILNAQPPSYPPGLSSQKIVGPNVNYLLEPGVPQPPKGYTWDQIGWVMGGYHSNARFIDTAGYVIVGDSTRYNLPTRRWVMYDQMEPGRKPYEYSCFRCHTTGPSQTVVPPFNQYPGIQGSWAEAGVGCEACHGPGSTHVSNPSVKPPKEGYETCNNCHARDRGTQFAWNLRVEWQPTTVQGTPTGFIRHREQGDMMFASKHHIAGMTCATCHNPHKGVYYELGGVKPTPNCQTCHANKEILGHGPAISTCEDCHMPFAARSADGLSPYVSEQSAHFWKILTSPITMFDNLDTLAAGRYFIKQDASGLSGLTLDYTCLQCHVTQNVTWAAQYAANIHTQGVSVDDMSEIPSAYSLMQNYPNPFNPSTKINFSLPVSSHVVLNVYSITGQLVQTLVNNEMPAGRHSVDFNASDISSGVYLYRLETEKFTSTRKMILIR